MNFPKQVSVFSASFIDVGQPEEILKLAFNYPVGNPGVQVYAVGTECFLESAVNMSQVPEEQLISCLSMASILAGGILPGTMEYISAVTDQSTKYFQTIIGNATLKSVTLVSDTTIGPDGTVYDVVFNKVGSNNNVKTIRADAWSLSDYDNRVDSPLHAVGCVPGAVHKQFGFKKSDLGAADSANRNAVIAFINTQKFWI